MDGNTLIITGKFTKEKLDKYAYNIRMKLNKPSKLSHERKIIRGSTEVCFKSLEKLYNHLVSEGLKNIKNYANFKYHFYKKNHIMTKHFRYVSDSSYRNLIQKL